MKKDLSKKEVYSIVESFFKRKEFNSEQLKKIRRLAMKYKIPLKEKRKLFCKYCLNKLEGKTRINKEHKSITCRVCNRVSKFKLK